MVLFEKKTLNVGDLSFCYAELGHVNASNVSLLLLHGFSNDKYSWGPYAVVGYIRNSYNRLHV